MELHETPRGARFYDAQIPQLIKALNRVADALPNQQNQGFSKKISEKTKQRLQEIMNDSEKAENFANALISEMSSDDEKISRKGHYIAKAILDNNAEDMLIAICGWSSEKLLNIAEYGKANPNMNQATAEMKMDGIT